jgi:hypothetical protein
VGSEATYSLKTEPKHCRLLAFPIGPLISTPSGYWLAQDRAGCHTAQRPEFLPAEQVTAARATSNFWPLQSKRKVQQAPLRSVAMQSTVSKVLNKKIF